MSQKIFPFFMTFSLILSIIFFNTQCDLDIETGGSGGTGSNNGDTTDTGTSGSAGGCTVDTVGNLTCYSYDDVSYAATLEAQCTALSGTYSADECDLDDAVGTCEGTAAGYNVQYGTGYTVDNATSLCTGLGGTLTE
jgi:hypothetical protein